MDGSSQIRATRLHLESEQQKPAVEFSHYRNEFSANKSIGNRGIINRDQARGSL